MSEWEGDVAQFFFYFISIFISLAHSLFAAYITSVELCVRDRKREGECEADVEGKIMCETEKERERTFEVWWKYVKGKKKKEIIEDFNWFLLITLKLNYYI